MTDEIAIAVIAGALLGFWLRCPKVTIKRVLEVESDTIARVRAVCEAAVTWRKERLLSDHCGWSEADDLRSGMRNYESILAVLPEPPTASETSK